VKGCHRWCASSIRARPATRSRFPGDSMAAEGLCSLGYYRWRPLWQASTLTCPRHVAAQPEALDLLSLPACQCFLMGSVSPAVVRKCDRPSLARSYQVGVKTLVLPYRRPFVLSQLPCWLFWLMCAGTLLQLARVMCQPKEASTNTARPQVWQRKFGAS
jgi:hypothetical protein